MYHTYLVWHRMCHRTGLVESLFLEQFRLGVPDVSSGTPNTQYIQKSANVAGLVAYQMCPMPYATVQLRHIFRTATDPAGEHCHIWCTIKCVQCYRRLCNFVSGELKWLFGGGGLGAYKYNSNQLIQHPRAEKQAYNLEKHILVVRVIQVPWIV